MAPKRIHMSLDVRGVLKNAKKRDYKGMFRHEDGRPMTADEAKSALSITSLRCRHCSVSLTLSALGRTDRRKTQQIGVGRIGPLLLREPQTERRARTRIGQAAREVDSLGTAAFFKTV